jgi:hypothetical protein
MPDIKRNLRLRLDTRSQRDTMCVLSLNEHLNEMRLRTEIRASVVAFGLLVICFLPVFAQEEDPFDSPLYHVVNTYSE